MILDWVDVFETVESENELITATEDYIDYVVDEYDMDIDVSYIVGLRVSKRTKRTGAYVRHYNLSELSVGVKPDWSELEYSLGEGGFEDIRDCEITLSWGAFESFTSEEWMDNVRHELIHVEEIQKYGDSNHGWRFKQRAREVDASTSCPKFTEYKYELYCKECDKFISGKYKKSKMVKNPNKYITRCCDANLYVEEK